MGNSFVDDLLFEDNKAVDIPIDALRTIFNIVADLRNEQLRPQDKPKQLSLFEEDFESEHNTFAAMKIKNKLIFPSGSSKQVINAMEFLTKFKMGWYTSTNSKEKEIKTYGGLITAPTYDERGYTSFLISSYWLKKLIVIPEYNPTLYGTMEKYTDRKVSEWLIKHIVNAEGYREKAYYATQKELLKKQFTIGCGTSYLFNGDGTPYITNHPYIGLNGVRLSDNLTALKKSMGYNNLTAKSFDVRLVRNYLVGNGTSGFIMLSIMENMKVRYSERVKDAMLEWSYGSGSAHKSIRGDYKDKYAYLNRTKEFNDFVNSFIGNYILFYTKF